MGLTSTISEKEILQLLDFDYEVSCIYVRKEGMCGAPARWWVACRYCRHGWSLCDSCLERSRVWGERIGKTRCGRCFYTENHWDMLVSVTPLEMMK